MIEDRLVKRFAALYAGRVDAYGLGKGQVVKQPLTIAQYEDHLNGKGSGLGVFPLLDDGTVWWAAIDLDEPDFDAAYEMQQFLPGITWVERSRSGNAHVLVFFKSCIEAWIPRGILRNACEAVGKYRIEVFPKQDRLLDGMVGNYLNLSYHGTARTVIQDISLPSEQALKWCELTLTEFVVPAYNRRNDPAEWEKRADWLGIQAPKDRQESSEFGTQATLHICAEHIIANRERNPVREGHRNVVFFSLAKMLHNYEGFDDDEVLYYLRLVNEASPDEVPDEEIVKISENAKRGRFTSTGCSDPLLSPYVHPDCQIVKGL